MNHFFYETRGKERVTELMEEGLRAQALHRSRALKPSVLRGLPKIILGFLSTLGIIAGLLSRLM